MPKCKTCKEELTKQRKNRVRHKDEMVGWTIYWISKNHHLKMELKKD